jgi:hypothetical protein
MNVDLTKDEIDGLMSIIDGTLDSMRDLADPEEYEYWLNILDKLGERGHDLAEEWRKEL